MLTLERGSTAAPDYSTLNSSIKETFTALDRYEWQAVGELQKMRDGELYIEAGYTSFKEYCERELSAWGGFRRINQLLGAKRVIDTVGELGEHIRNERQARPLLRLLQEPEKLREAVAYAIAENPSPSESDFALAAQKVVPRTPRQKTSTTEPMVPQGVKVTSPSHPRYGDEGTIQADAPNPSQQIVTFADGEKLLVNNDDLDIPTSPVERTYPNGYAEAIAQIKQQHQQELERLEQELRIRLVSEAKAQAEQQVLEQLIASQQLYQQQKQQNIELQQRLDEMEALRQLEVENQQLKRRIQQLENAVEERPAQQWGFGKSRGRGAARGAGGEIPIRNSQFAVSNLDNCEKQRIENCELSSASPASPASPALFLDLRSLAQEPPKENAQECLRLMGIALSNLATAMNNTQALQAAAIILGSEPNKSAIAHRAEQLQLLPQAVTDIRQVLAQPGCTWQDYITVATEYEVIKADYLAELQPQEIELITALEQASSFKTTEPMVLFSTPTEDGSPSNFTNNEPMVPNSTPTDPERQTDILKTNYG
ncbi:hypothetical protein [Anabaena azotica]|uniref:ATPase involved in DNA repair n=1 Tax=Anabaena azotica FACHB-119 TaxID=947527 RepID=A0ABR8DE63_9NOST|nr:hypothetical protein [Anabaena azotica]MBD2505227.1 hypothetical protein [Anabaena azotica FACHB-119]